MPALRRLHWLWLLALLFQAPSWALDTEPFIKNSFLNLKEDLADAARQRRMLMVIFEQDGCPYCEQMHRVNFKDPAIVASIRKGFDVIQLDIWGGREVSDFTGASMTEKALARKLSVQFSPTIVFYDGNGREVYRVAGLHKPAVFQKELAFLSSRSHETMRFTEYASPKINRVASADLIDEPFFARGNDLDTLAKKAWSRDKVLALLFVQAQCDDCRDMHERYFTRKDTVGLLKRHFEVARIDLDGSKILTAPGGARVSEAELARSLDIQRAPTLVFFDRNGKEILRNEKYLTPENFTAGLLTYLGTHAYRKYDSLQDWLRIMSVAPTTSR